MELKFKSHIKLIYSTLERSGGDKNNDQQRDEAATKDDTAKEEKKNKAEQPPSQPRRGPGAVEEPGTRYNGMPQIKTFTEEKK